VANWKHLFFFDKSGKNYNMKYDSSTDKWTGDIFLPQVSIDLFEVGQLFILQKMKDANSGTFMFGYPHGYAQQSTGDNCDWTVGWETTQPDKIFLFQFNKDFNTGTQSALVQEPDGPPLIKVDKLLAPLQYDANQTVSPDGFIITDEIKSEALQIDIAFFI
jgi:hypothetical protein